MLLLIALAIDFTRKPENWRWFFSVGNEQPAELELKELSLDDLDFRVPDPEHGTLPPDTFLAVTDPAPTIDLDQLGLDIKQIPPELLEGVQDKRVGLLRSEEAAMERVLKRVRAITTTELETAADGDIGYRVVYTDSEQFRGKLVKLEGTLWRFQKIPFGDPETTEDDLWQAWMFSSDSGNNPWVVFMVDKPDEIEVGEAINREVRVAGYFFKNYGYATEEGLHIAPMLISKTMKVLPLPPPVDTKTEDLSLYVFLFLMTIGLLFALMVWWFARSDRKFEKSHLAELAEARHDLTTNFVASLNDQEPNNPDKLKIPGSNESQ